MTGLILKDFINLKRNLRIFSILIVLYGARAITSKDASFFSSIFTMLFAILIMSTFSYDEMAKWDVYALTMPISRDNIVQGKYLMALILTVLGTAISSLFTIALNIVMELPSVVKGLEVSFLGAAIILLYYSVTLPIITKMGVEKGRFIFFAMYMIPYFCSYIISRMAGRITISESLSRMLQLALDNIVIILPLVVALSLALSYRISIGIYRKKEF